MYFITPAFSAERKEAERATKWSCSTPRQAPTLLYAPPTPLATPEDFLPIRRGARWPRCRDRKNRKNFTENRKRAQNFPIIGKPQATAQASQIRQLRVGQVRLSEKLVRRERSYPKVISPPTRREERAGGKLSKKCEHILYFTII